MALNGLYGFLADQHGVDSWQALKLAYNLAVGLLGSFVEKGGRLFLWPNEAAITLEELRELF